MEALPPYLRFSSSRKVAKDIEIVGVSWRRDAGIDEGTLLFLKKSNKRQ